MRFSHTHESAQSAISPPGSRIDEDTQAIIAQVIDALTNGGAGCFLLFFGDFSVTVGVDCVAAFLTTFLAKLLDGLALLFIDDSVLIGVELLEEFRGLEDEARSSPKSASFFSKVRSAWDELAG